ncbi:hydroxymethylglutaryl-CoA lyase [Roseovarius sp. S1116L3]|uniref:hydroxymethylglutaryl-CoA lyase n=1 Tax=Roseovarius roseus TaxID=3342636 RepID=UPI003727FC48
MAAKRDERGDTMSGDHVTLFEVGPRDGLQSLQMQVPTADKIALIDALGQTGLTRIEAASFVSPKWVPQMADGAAVMAGITRAPGVRYAALTPNMRAFEAAVAARVDEVAVFASASEGFSQANLNCTIEQSLARFAPLLEAAREIDLPVRGYLSAVIACPYDGPTPPGTVADLAARLVDMGCYEVSLGDTIGAGAAGTAHGLFDAVLEAVPASRLAGHFHDTHGTALEMVRAALARGLRVFDSSVAGLGGCPYAPGAPGNVATETLARLCAAEGYETGIDLIALDRCAALARRITG